MTSPARNEPCPCGSGKKYKKCCLVAPSISQGAEAGTFADQLHTIIFSESMLMNRVDREARVVTESFDSICREAIGHLETMYSRVAALLYIGVDNAKALGDDLRHTGAIVLTNALKSLTAAFALLRTGWRLQPHLCLRNGMEAASVVMHLLQCPNDLQKFKDGQLESQRTLKSAKAAMPPIGKLYGILSDEFVHIGKPFLHIQKGNVYSESEWEMWQCLASITGFAHMLYMVAELLLHNWVSEPQCWVQVDVGGYAVQWSEEMTRWRKDFIRIYRPHYKGELTKD